jgi:hypothetical protein
MLTLPGEEPCSALDEKKRLQRGNLHREAKAAAELVSRIIAECWGSEEGRRAWVNAKRRLSAAGPGTAAFEHFKSTAGLGKRCWGPHSPAGMADLSDLLEMEKEVVHER